MGKYYVLYNPYAGNGRGRKDSEALKTLMKNDDLEFCDITKIISYKDFFSKVAKDEAVIISGGDGTLNRFINNTDSLDIENDILYFATGSGNDFLNDLNKKKGEKPFSIKKYIKHLPEVTVNGQKSKFLNGIGYGIDGYCCEIGDKKRNQSGKPINYTTIALKGLFIGYNPTNAIITVDGKRYIYNHVWLVPTMNGRFFGGGMMATPNQDRLNSDHVVSVAVMSCKSRFKTLMAFPSIFKGEHITKHKDLINIFTGHKIMVEFDRPTALQIDGETIKNVSRYSVSSSSSKVSKEKEFETI